ncbi:unnamed protein product [Knipowitschia caucasica]|uniref:Dentin sialophosphoprotein-like n=2 Tax=Knipowitschia caucasica TaxID=637954 RepID=A0AAV2LMD0_KNICA
MKVIVIFACLFCAIVANPITIKINLDSSEINTNSTETLFIAQSSGNETSGIQSSESESSESVESASSDNTSEESDSLESNENLEMLAETRDDSMGSEENIRKSFVQVYSTVAQNNSVEDNSTEVKQPELLVKLSEKQPISAPTAKTMKQKVLSLLESKTTGVSSSSSESAEIPRTTGLITVTADSSESSESNETSSSSSESSESSHSSQSDENSNSSNTSAEVRNITQCVNGTQSCESEEYFFQDIGDDANYSFDNMMVPDEDERELSLRR